MISGVDVYGRILLTTLVKREASRQAWLFVKKYNEWEEGPAPRRENVLTDEEQDEFTLWTDWAEDML